MSFRRTTIGLTTVLAVSLAVTAPEAQRGRGGGRGGIRVMTMSVAGWPDGGEIPLRHAQAGGDVSPAITWDGVPDGAESFVLIVRDVDARTGTGDLDLLHWLVWNIPATSTGLPEGVPQGAELADGTRQISVTGPEYRGPAPPPTDPPHHYLFELYALDARLTVRAADLPPAETRAAVLAAMAGHILGRATYVGRFRQRQ